MWYFVIFPILFFSFVLSIINPWFVLSNTLRQAATDSLVLKSLELLPDRERASQIISEQASSLSLVLAKLQVSTSSINLQWNHSFFPLGDFDSELSLVEAGGVRAVVQHDPLIMVLDEFPQDVATLDCSSSMAYARRSAVFNLIKYYKSVAFEPPTFLMLGPEQLEDYRLFSKRFGGISDPLSVSDLDSVCVQAGKEFAEIYSSEVKEGAAFSLDYTTRISNWLYANQSKLPAIFTLLLVSAASSDSVTNQEILSLAEKINSWALSSGRQLQIIWALGDNGKSNEYLNSLTSIYNANNSQIQFRLLVLDDPTTLSVKLPYLVAASSRRYQISR